ncbi:excinuclease ABC, C subunit [Chlamydia psittaci]|nr:excinuclease ABC, C subunit [Chlamydia psittaci]UMB84524.1 excinuclease ABC, C subunit [Chlamydia psittaci]
MRVKDFTPKLIPTSPGVYLMKDSSGEVLYIGKAKNLRNRISTYFRKQGDSRERIPFLMKKTTDIETILVSNETEAFLLENNLIKKYHPKYNVLLKDDKTFFCLAISLTHLWPKIDVIRTKAVTSSKKQIIFGPYVSAEACRTLLEVISQWFPLRTCSNREFASRKRPCILYEMKRCLAPCVNLCSHEEYEQTLEKAILFLKGQVSEVVQDLEKSIEKASKEQKFEQAGMYYRTLQLIQQAMVKQHVEKFHFQNIDAIGLYRKYQKTVITILTIRSGKLLGARHFPFSENAQEDADLLASFILQYYTSQPQTPKEILTPIPLNIPDLPYLLNKDTPPQLRSPKTGYGRELLNLAKNNAQVHAETTIQSSALPYEELKKILKSSDYPYRIECYDNAHLQGSHAVGVYIVYENDALSPKDYRTFSISSSAYNDLAAFREVLSRRFTSLTSSIPDMILIDGGRTQYAQAKKTLKELNLTGIQVVSIAKEAGSHSSSLKKEKLFCDTFPQGVLLPPTSKLLQFFQKLRDEAHRFAISRHRKKRHKDFLLPKEKIPGIGEIKRKRLLQKFKSWEQVMKASQGELEAIPGLTKKDIQHLLAKQAEDTYLEDGKVDYSSTSSFISSKKSSAEGRSATHNSSISSSDSDSDSERSLG